MSEKTASIFLFYLAMIGGLGTVANAIVLEEGLSNLQCVLGRLFLSSLFYFVICFKKIKMIHVSYIKIACFIAVLNVFGFQLMLRSFCYSPVASIAFVMTSSVVFVPLLGSFLYRKKPDIYIIIASFLILIGNAILSLTKDFTLDYGVVLALIATLSFSTMSLSYEWFIKKRNCDVVRLTACTHWISCLLSFAIVMLAKDFKYSFTSRGFFYLFVSGVLCTGFFSLTYNRMQKYTNSVKCVLITSLQAIFAVIFNLLIRKGAISLRQCIAFVIIALAVILSETKLKFLHRKIKNGRNVINGKNCK